LRPDNNGRFSDGIQIWLPDEAHFPFAPVFMTADLSGLLYQCPQYDTEGKASSGAKGQPEPSQLQAVQ